ncbi:MAG: ABC-type branched-chain amino acid transport system, ATPase component [Burkholderia sp.]|nr:ABC-type branched-chain amino acid transport system, ATPase component [Burkholderia sp.]
MNAPLLRLAGIRAGYGASNILNGIDLDVRKGQITVVLGSNGAGKTTLMRVLSGLLPAKSGTIAFEGSDITALQAAERVDLGISLTPEGRSVFPDFTVDENLRMGAFLPRARAGMDARKDSMFSLFPKLRDRRNQLARTLSGGEQQMLAIARSLMSEPKLLLLDEPSLGLAPIVVRQLFESIERIREQGVTVLMVEQDANAALAIADRAFVVEIGEVTLQGPAEEIQRDPRIRAAYLGL